MVASPSERAREADSLPASTERGRVRQQAQTRRAQRAERVATRACPEAVELRSATQPRGTKQAARPSSKAPPNTSRSTLATDAKLPQPRRCGRSILLGWIAREASRKKCGRSGAAEPARLCERASERRAKRGASQFIAFAFEFAFAFALVAMVRASRRHLVARLLAWWCAGGAMWCAVVAWCVALVCLAQLNCGVCLNCE